MSKINVKFLTDEALATIKANLDKFTKIVKENPSDSSSFIAELPEECFVEKKYPIEDFELEVDGDGDYSKVDVDNAITLYEHLCCLPKHVLGDERFWMWLILEKCYAATIQAMPMERRLLQTTGCLGRVEDVVLCLAHFLVHIIEFS